MLNPNDLLAGLLQGGQGFAANPVQPPAPTAGADPASSELLQILQPNNIPMPETVEADPLSTKQRVLGSIFQGLSAYGAGLNPNVQANDVIGNLMQQNAEKANQTNEANLRQFAVDRQDEQNRVEAFKYATERGDAKEAQRIRQEQDAANLALRKEQLGWDREKEASIQTRFERQLERQEGLDEDGRMAARQANQRYNDALVQRAEAEAKQERRELWGNLSGFADLGDGTFMVRGFDNPVSADVARNQIGSIMRGYGIEDGDSPEATQVFDFIETNLPGLSERQVADTATAPGEPLAGTAKALAAAREISASNAAKAAIPETVQSIRTEPNIKERVRLIRGLDRASAVGAAQALLKQDPEAARELLGALRMPTGRGERDETAHIRKALGGR